MKYCWLLAAALGVWTTAGHAQPKARTETPAANALLHDGLYLRLGVGFMHVRSTEDGGNDPYYSADEVNSGAGFAMETFAGGTPLRGLVLGGGALGVYFPGLSCGAADGSYACSGPDALLFAMVGPFVQYYFDPRLGGYAQLFGGYAIWQEVRKGYETSDTHFAGTESGFGIALRGGWDFWVRDQWSFGPALHVMFGRVVRETYRGDEERPLRLIGMTFGFTLH